MRSRAKPRPRPKAKGTCLLLYQQYKRCKKMPLTQGDFTSMCVKLIDRPRTKDEVACSTAASCKIFTKCIRVADKRNSVKRMARRWGKAMNKVQQGDYSSAMSFCRVWKEDLNDQLKAKCKALPAQATAHLLGEIANSRDAGRLSYKDILCWDLKRYAKKAGPPWIKKADLLCREVELARDLVRVRKSVAKYLKKTSPALPYYCYEKQLATHRKIGTKYAKNVVAKMVQLCYRKLGRYILQKKVPKQKYTCWVKAVFRGIKKYKIRGPVIDRFMRQAARKCK